MELETDVDMSELANLPPVSISFEVTLPHEEEVVTLLQVLQEDVEGYFVPIPHFVFFCSTILVLFNLQEGVCIQLFKPSK
jgi:hypothetical protein